MFQPQKLYMCGQCDFKTIRISTLRRHELIHSEDKLLLCRLCPYKTDDPKFLAKHNSLKHSGNVSAVSVKTLASNSLKNRYFSNNKNYTSVNRKYHIIINCVTCIKYVLVFNYTDISQIKMK